MFSNLPSNIAYADDVDFLTEIEKKKQITLNIANKTLKKDNLNIMNQKLKKHLSKEIMINSKKNGDTP